MKTPTRRPRPDRRSKRYGAVLIRGCCFGERRIGAALVIDGCQDLAPWLTQERVVKQIADETDASLEPRRLIEGLNKAFGKPG